MKRILVTIFYPTCLFALNILMGKEEARTHINLDMFLKDIMSIYKFCFSQYFLNCLLHIVTSLCVPLDNFLACD